MGAIWLLIEKRNKKLNNKIIIKRLKRGQGGNTNMKKKNLKTRFIEILRKKQTPYLMMKKKVQKTVMMIIMIMMVIMMIFVAMMIRSTMIMMTRLMSV